MSTNSELIEKARRYDANTRAATGRTHTLYGELADALEAATRVDGVWTCGHCGHDAAAHGLIGHQAYMCVYMPVWKPMAS